MEFLAPSSRFLLAAIGALLGGIVGSYLATILWRLPRGASANRGRSECDACAAPLRWFAIIPVAGFIITRGTCRRCGSRITCQHLAIELACAVSGAWAFAFDQPLLAPFVWLLLVLAMFDALYLWLPNPLVAATAGTALLAPPPEVVSWSERLAGGAAGFALFWLVASAYRALRGRVGLGGGDAKLFGAIGLWCGLGDLPWILLSASMLGIFTFLVLWTRGLADGGKRLPLGTFLAICAVALALGSSAADSLAHRDPFSAQNAQRQSALAGAIAPIADTMIVHRTAKSPQQGFGRERLP